MALTCNIDSEGKRARLISGIVFVFLGLILGALWLWPVHHALMLIACVFCLISGGFTIFEARAGWCVVRAMGFKTRI